MKSRDSLQKPSFFAFLLLCVLSSSSHASNILSLDSSEESWVGAGQARYITPDDGYTFTAETKFDNGLSFSIRHEAPYNDPLYDYWTLDLSAPFDAMLSEGVYDDATRWPFQEAGNSGLTFSGNHRGNNRNLGFFEVLEATYNPQGNVERFAVNFTQYGEQNSDWWIVGQLRFNSDVPVAVPEPSTILLSLVGLLGLVLASRGSRH